MEGEEGSNKEEGYPLEIAVPSRRTPSQPRVHVQTRRGAAASAQPSVGSKDPPHSFVTMEGNPLGSVFRSRQSSADIPRATRTGTEELSVIRLTKCTLDLPGEDFPIFGWFRENAVPRPDAFFGSDGSHYPMTRATVEATRIATLPPEQLNRLVHPALQTAARQLLTDPNYLFEGTPPVGRPVTGDIWKETMPAHGKSPMSYVFVCHLCRKGRLLRRSAALPTDSINPDYRFYCRDLGIDCRISNPVPRVSFPRTRYPEREEYSPQRPWQRPASVPRLIEEEPFQPRPAVEADTDSWRKQMRYWAGAITYDGAPSLVQLRGWYSSLREAYDTVQVPEGRDEVLQALRFLTGEAEKWWRSVAGQPQGQSLRSLDDLSSALEKRFIPRGIYTKAMNDWASLRQTGTAEEYMRRVDELAVVMPLGDAAEYAHALRGMRAEIRAEIEFRMQELDLPYCSREELWRFMWLAETRYPQRQPRPFLPHFKSRFPAATKAASASSLPLIVCWICDGEGHRASVCPRRHGSGCARCGSKAHSLITCPQRSTPRRSTPAQTPKAPPRRGGRPTQK